MNYEAIRAVVRQAIERTLPIDREEDGTAVIGFDKNGPIWGSPSVVVEAITTGVMQALYPASVTLPDGEQLEGDPRTTGRWTCGCDSSKCDIRWTVGRDASADPSQVVRATCHSHGIYGDSESARVADNPAMRQQAQALFKLDLAHQEQCR